MDERARRAIDDVVSGFSAASGLDVYLVEVVIRGGGRKIEVIADTDQGIGIGQCAALSRRIRERLESLEGAPMFAEGDFELMVASPGIGEPIRVKRQYVRHTGRLIRVEYDDGAGGKREMTGRLLEACVGSEEEPFIVIGPKATGAKKKKEGPPAPLRLRLADISKAWVQTEL